jgi:hypothetical protein
MKLYAQHGHADGLKTSRAIDNRWIDGVIYSPKDISLSNLTKMLTGLKKDYPSVDRLFDPQVYASFLAVQANSRMGSLLEDYAQPIKYFSAKRKAHFEVESNVRDQIKRAVAFQLELPLTAVIAPNIYIQESFNSIEGAISKSFIRNTKDIADGLGVKIPVYATLSISRDALLNQSDFIEFLTDITALDNPPDGFYLLVGASKADARAEIFHPDVIAGWMLLNRTLAENGFKIINGYSDILSPFLGLAGGHAGASGWWSNLRTFSLDRFAPPVGGGSLPLVRYLSIKMLGRISFYELEQIRSLFPAVMNSLPSDSMYPQDDEPARVDEVLQTWNALSAMNSRVLTGSFANKLSNIQKLIEDAEAFRTQIQLTAIRLDNKSDGSHLEPMQEGLARFLQLAELG